MKQFIIIEKLSLCVCLFSPFHLFCSQADVCAQLLCLVLQLQVDCQKIEGGREKCKSMAAHTIRMSSFSYRREISAVLFFPFFFFLSFFYFSQNLSAQHLLLSISMLLPLFEKEEEVLERANIKYIYICFSLANEKHCTC